MDRNSAITVLVVGGTGESHHGDTRTEVTGLLAGVTEGLDARFTTRWVGYAASYGPAPRVDGMSYADSVVDGEHRLRAALNETPGDIMVIGYSQGAVVIRRLLHRLDAESASAELLARVLAVGLVADPHQPPGAVADCTGWGVAGPGEQMPAHIPVCWIGAPEDMICNAEPDSLVRDIADLTDQLSFRTVGRWCRSMLNRLSRNEFQNASATRVAPHQWRRDPGRVVDAGRAIRRYLPAAIAWRGMAVDNPDGGRHTSYGCEPYRRASLTDPTSTGCQRLTAWLQVRATFAPVHPDSASTVTLAG